MWIYNTENKTIKQQDQRVPCVTGEKHARGAKRKKTFDDVGFW